MRRLLVASIAPFALVAVCFTGARAQESQELELEYCDGSITSAGGAARDGAAFQCLPCAGRFSVLGSTDTDAPAMPDVRSVGVLGDAMGCRCGPGYALEIPTNSSVCDVTSPAACIRPPCRQCAADGRAASRDGTRCMQCPLPGTVPGRPDFTSVLNGTTLECTCPAGYVLTDAPQGVAALSPVAPAVGTGGANATIVNTPVSLADAAASAAAPARKACVPCPSGQRAFWPLDAAGTRGGVGAYAPDPYVCRGCSDPRASMGTDGVCRCGAGYVSSGVEEAGPGAGPSCVPQDVVVALEDAGLGDAAAAAVTFEDVRQPPSEGGATGATVGPIQSLAMRALYLRAAAACWVSRGPILAGVGAGESLGGGGSWIGDQGISTRTEGARALRELEQRGAGAGRACQVLANLCVLTGYDFSHPACRAYREIQGARAGAAEHGWAGWPQSGSLVPFLVYDSVSAATETRVLDQRMKLGLDVERGRGDAAGVTSSYPWRLSALRLVVARWSLRGELLGVEPVRWHLQRCRPEHGASMHGAQSAPGWLAFGAEADERTVCELDGMAADAMERARAAAAGDAVAGALGARRTALSRAAYAELAGGRGGRFGAQQSLADTLLAPGAGRGDPDTGSTATVTSDGRRRLASAGPTLSGGQGQTGWQARSATQGPLGGVLPHTEVLEMFIVEADGGQAEAGGRSGAELPPVRLVPVPVRVRGLKQEDGSQPNQNALLSQEGDDVLVRRFFLFDAAAGSVQPGQPPQVVRFAS